MPMKLLPQVKKMVAVPKNSVQQRKTDSDDNNDDEQEVIVIDPVTGKKSVVKK